MAPVFRDDIFSKNVNHHRLSVKYIGAVFQTCREVDTIGFMGIRPALEYQYVRIWFERR
jgi:hypothetical protein